MTIVDIKKQIQNKSLQSYYIFTGEEIEIQRIYVNKIAEVLNRQVVRIESVAEMWRDIITPSIFDDKQVYVVRDDKDLMQNEKLQSQIENGALKDNILIHLVTSVDKRTKWYKANSDKIVVFEHLSSEVLKKYICKHITLNNANCERLIAICENDYSRILLEIDKIKRFNAENPDLAFEQMLEEGAIYVPPKDAIFDLVDAILKRQINQVYDLLYQSYAVGEANMVILSVLYNNAKQVLQVQACEDPDVCKSTGLTPFQVKCAKKLCGYYSIGELVDLLLLIQQTQKNIITGNIEDNISIEYLLVQIL